MRSERRLISFFLLILTPLFIAGCATYGPDHVKKPKVSIFRITVTTTPDNSNVYLNNKFLGKSPLNNFPIEIKYDLYGDVTLTSLFSYDWSIHPMLLQYYLFIDHPGYYGAAVELKFDSSPQDKLKMILKQNKFDFVLSKNDAQEQISGAQYLEQEYIADAKYSKNEGGSNTMDLYFGMYDMIFTNTNMWDLEEHSLLKRAIAKAALVSGERGFNYFSILSKKFYVTGDREYFKEVDPPREGLSLIKLKFRMEKESGVDSYDAQQVLDDIRHMRHEKKLEEFNVEGGGSSIDNPIIFKDKTNYSLCKTKYDVLLEYRKSQERMPEYITAKYGRQDVGWKLVTQGQVPMKNGQWTVLEWNIVLLPSEGKISLFFDITESLNLLEKELEKYKNRPIAGK